MDQSILEKLIDKNFIDIYHSDLSKMNKTNIINHYIQKGHKERRIVSDLHVQIILRNSYFNIGFYKSHYGDVKDMSVNEIIYHYVSIGRKEERIVSRKHASMLTNTPDFDIDFYQSHNIDLHNMTPMQLVNHYNYHGKYENRVFCNKYVSKIPDGTIFDTNRIQICIIYVYYERKNEQKNQTNLAFFIKHGLDKSRWRNMDITTLIMVNGRQCELLIPEMENVHILYNNNERDITSIKKGVQYFENKYNTPFYNSFTHLLIMNCGIIGPIYEEGLDRHWLDPFLNKLTNNTVLCSPCINFLKKEDMGGPGPRGQSYCSLIKINDCIYNLLFNVKISNLAPGTTDRSIQLKYDYVFSDNNINIANTILIGEYGLTRILLDNGYNISCLIYGDVDYNDQTIWDTYSDRIDRIPNMTIEHFNTQIFIKNYWRTNSTKRDSLPCFYQESISYMCNKFNYKNIFDDVNSIEYNYDLININSIGCLRNEGIIWNNKKEFYNLFGFAEEHIIWPQPKPNNTACVIYCHYDKDNIIKDYVIQALKTLIVLEYDIYFCTTCGEIKNVVLPFEIHYYENVGAGSDFIMINNIVNSKQLSKYLWINFLNDSIILPIHGIENMKNTILRMRETNDFWGLYESNERRIHLCSNCFFEISIKCLDTLNIFYNKTVSTCRQKEEFINNIEILQTQHLVNNGFKYGAVVSYKDLIHSNCIMFNPININKYLINKDCFGIKWKYLGNYINYNDVNNPYLNYLMRYLKLSKEKIPQIPNHFKQ